MISNQILANQQTGSSVALNLLSSTSYASMANGCFDFATFSNSGTGAIQNYVAIAQFGTSQLTIMNITNVNKPYNVSTFNLTGILAFPQAICTDGSSLVYLIGQDHYLSTFNVYYAPSPVLVGVLQVDSSVSSNYYQCSYGSISGRNYVFISSDQSGLIIVDVTVPLSPVVIFKQTGIHCAGMTNLIYNGSTPYLYNVTFQTSGFSTSYIQCWNMTNPSSPVLTQYAMPTYSNGQVSANSCQAFGTNLYIGDNITPAFRIFSVGSPTSPSLLQEIDFAINIGTLGTGKNFYMTTSGATTLYVPILYTQPFILTPTLQMQVYDLTNIYTPILLTTLVLGSYLSCISIFGIGYNLLVGVNTSSAPGALWIYSLIPDQVYFNQVLCSDLNAQDAVNAINSVNVGTGPNITISNDEIFDQSGDTFVIASSGNLIFSTAGEDNPALTLNDAGTCYVNYPTSGTSPSLASLVTYSLGTTENAFIGGNLNVSSGSTSTGSLGVTSNATIGGTLTNTGTIFGNSPATSISSITGNSIISAGGIGAYDCYIANSSVVGGGLTVALPIICNSNHYSLTSISGNAIYAPSGGLGGTFLYISSQGKFGSLLTTNSISNTSGLTTDTITGTNATQSTSTTTGAFKTAGGLGVAYQMSCADLWTASNPTTFALPSTNMLGQTTCMIRNVISSIIPATILTITAVNVSSYSVSINGYLNILDTSTSGMALYNISLLIPVGTVSLASIVPNATLIQSIGTQTNITICVSSIRWAYSLNNVSLIVTDNVGGAVNYGAELHIMTL